MYSVGESGSEQSDCPCFVHLRSLPSNGVHVNERKGLYPEIICRDISGFDKTETQFSREKCHL